MATHNILNHNKHVEMDNPRQHETQDSIESTNISNQKKRKAALEMARDSKLDLELDKQSNDSYEASSQEKEEKPLRRHVITDKDILIGLKHLIHAPPQHAPHGRKREAWEILISKVNNELGLPQEQHIKARQLEENISKRLKYFKIAYPYWDSSLFDASKLEIVEHHLWKYANTIKECKPRKVYNSNDVDCYLSAEKKKRDSESDKMKNAAKNLDELLYGSDSDLLQLNPLSSTESMYQEDCIIVKQSYLNDLKEYHEKLVKKIKWQADLIALLSDNYKRASLDREEDQRLLEQRQRDNDKFLRSFQELINNNY